MLTHAAIKWPVIMSVNPIALLFCTIREHRTAVTRDPQKTEIRRAFDARDRPGTDV